MKRKEIYNEVLDQFKYVTGTDLADLSFNDEKLYEELTDDIYSSISHLPSNVANDTERVTLSETDSLDEEYEVEITKTLDFDFKGKTYYIFLWYDC